MLAAGTSLGPYKILAPLGAGGMGEVYRAHDTRLGRDVAIKVLPQHLAATPEVRARFEREARTISQLNHPHICTLYDVGHQDGTDYLVMELLEGETLAHRLEKGPLPVAEVLSLGTQIADALDRAHRAGVVHRDLKPGNVMLTKAGAKLMDFGLARAMGLAPVASALTESPTVSRPLTAEGTIVGTFQYMAPEQLEGKEADARTDLWALGCVLYEAATGKRAFEGKSQASLIAAIIEREPTPPSQLVPLLPPALDRVVQQCLTKDPDERIQTAHDVKLQLQWITSGGSQAGVPAPVAARRRGREKLAWIMAFVAGAVAMALGGALLQPYLAKPPRVVRFDLQPPRGTPDVLWPRLSPDGRTLAFLSLDSTGTRRLWVRPMDALEARPLGELEMGVRPFWSPDGRYLAFIVGGKLRKVPVAGGPVIDICDVPGGSDGTWGNSGWILFDGVATDSIRGVPAWGGVPRAITFVDRAHGETGHAWPFFLPDGRHFLFVAGRMGSLDEIHLGTLGSKESRLLGHTENRVEYAPPGYLVYMNGGLLVAQPFDARSGRTTGEPTPVSESPVLGPSGHFSVSGTGVLAYVPQGSRQQARLLWFARDGRALGEAAPPGGYEGVALSPDGSRLALSIVGVQPPTRDIWVRDLGRGANSRLTFDPSDHVAPVWSPDGRRIAFGRIGAEEMHCYVRAANGVGAEDSLRPSGAVGEAPSDWSGAANTIVVERYKPGATWDVWAMAPDGRKPPRSLVQSSFSAREGRLSPDGRWLAYSSRESGRDEIYVIPYPGPGGKWQVSTAGGSCPQWRGDGKELFFQEPHQSIMAVEVHAETEFHVGMPKLLFTTTINQLLSPGCTWAVSRDGQRFLVNAPSAGATTGHLVVVTNWTAELKKR